MTADLDTRRVLLVANETADGAVLDRRLRERLQSRPAEVLVVAPAVNTRLRHWTSDEDRARTEAEVRLHRCLAFLRGDGVNANGVVGDADPLQAIADALHGFPADELVIATHPPRRSHWLSRDVVARARRRFGLPVLHVSVETKARMPIAA
jgi:hypothetical protein